jgi:hypothetical protein
MRGSRSELHTQVELHVLSLAVKFSILSVMSAFKHNFSEMLKDTTPHLPTLPTVVASIENAGASGTFAVGMQNMYEPCRVPQRHHPLIRGYVTLD